MSTAYFELSYQRPADGREVLLAAELPTIRSIDVGGAPEGLRLPGADPQAVFFAVTPTGSAFSLERRDGDVEILVNDAPLVTKSHLLRGGDTVQVERYRLTFHEEPLEDDERLIDTQQRWKQRIPEGVRQEGDDPVDDDSAPYIKEFELTIRPLINAEAHAGVERRANMELLRVIRADEADALERYCRFLWSLRIAALSREDRQDEAEEICQHVIDLYPQDASLLAWRGTALLKRHDWPAAASTFSRCLRIAPRGDLRILHLARIGAALARDEIDNGNRPDGGYHRPIVPHSDDWDVPELELDAPGDEILYWYQIRTAQVFGHERSPQFRYLGNLNEGAGESIILQRWEIFDRAAGKLYRRIVRLPAIVYADPSLLIEGALLRHNMNQQDSNWIQGITDLSEADNPIHKSPVIFEPSVIEELAKSISETKPFVRVATARRSDDTFTFEINLVATPQPDDVVYKQGELKVAVAERDVELLAGARLSWQRDEEGESFCLESPNFSRVRVVKPAKPGTEQVSKPARIGRRLLQTALIILAASAVVRWIVILMR